MARNLRNGNFESAQEETDFTSYYMTTVFPNITDKANRQPTKDGQPPRDNVIAKLRLDLNECEKRGEKQVFNKLADLILEYMTEVAGNSNIHPVARVNAMLAIGEANSPKAAKVLLDTAFGPGQVFALRVAAMTGLIRMAGPSGRNVLANPAIEPLVVPKMVKCAQAKKKDDGISWMRGQAADMLAELGNSDGGVPAALLAMLSDKEDLPIPLRSKAAKALGKLNYNGNPPAAGPYLAALLDFARDALSSDQLADRLRVRLVAHDVLEGLKPFATSAAPGDQTLIDGLQKTLKQLNKETADKMTEADLKTSIQKARESLDGLGKK